MAALRASAASLQDHIPPVMPSSNDIRATFLDYFARNGHEVVASSPLVPRNDPTLLFTNSGMVQFKNVFTGQERRAYSTATTAHKSSARHCEASGARCQPVATSSPMVTGIMPAWKA